MAIRADGELPAASWDLPSSAVAAGRGLPLFCTIPWWSAEVFFSFLEREWSADSKQWLLNQTDLSSDLGSISQQVQDLGQVTDLSEPYFPHL